MSLSDLRRLCFLPLTLLLATQTLPAQKPTGARPSDSQQSGPYTLQMNVPLVVEDLVVLDSKNTPVHGLKESDITITEDGKPVKLRYFEEHTASPQDSAALPKPLNLGPNVFSNQQAKTDHGPLNILLLDSLNTSNADQVYVRDQMLKYLTNLPAGQRLAVFGLNNQLYLLQGFTSDPSVLKAIIESKGKPRTSQLINNTAVPEAAVDQLSVASADTAEMIANMQMFEADQKTFDDKLRISETLQAMDQLARYLSALPGRKNLIWFSGSFPLYVVPNQDADNAERDVKFGDGPFRQVVNYADDVRKTTNLLARARVAVYPIDARGVVTDPTLDLSKSGSTMSRNMKGRGSYTSTLREFGEATVSEHATMDNVADQTGGKAFYNSNGLKALVEQAVNYGANYYTFAYAPPDSTWNGKFRHVSIKVDKPGLHLDYRRGYLADDPNDAKPGVKVLPQTAMQTAMMRGGPEVAQIPFDVIVVPEDATGDKLVDGARINSKLMKAPYRNYTVGYFVDIHNVQLPAGADRIHHGSMEMDAMLYNANGELVNSIESTVALDLPADKYADTLQHGFRAHQTIQAPAKGEYFLRVGFHDAGSDRIGALEIPLTGLKSKQAVNEALNKGSSNGNAK